MKTVSNLDEFIAEIQNCTLSSLCIKAGYLILFILLLYFFMDQLYYAFILIFLICEICFLYYFFDIILKNNFHHELLNINAITFCQQYSITLNELIILALSIILPFWWFLSRMQTYSWILQDIIGFIVCIMFMQILRIPSFKLGFIIAGFLFFYDIFFVFITPLFTKGKFFK